MNTIFKNLLNITVAFAVATLSALAAHAGEPLSLYGSPLKGAVRTQLREALLKAGLKPTRVDDQYFCDLYAVNGQLKGASELSVCYTEDKNTFATATYTFPSFMDTDQVRRVVATVKAKYGAPNQVSGTYDLGNVTARWNEPQGEVIEVSRGWPDTTTYLLLEDRANAARMHAQIKRDQEQRTQRQAAKDASAF
jgi:hypothetical protein